MDGTTIRDETRVLIFFLDRKKFFEGMSEKDERKKKISFFFAQVRSQVHSKHISIIIGQKDFFTSSRELFSIANSRFLLRRREAAAALWGRTTAHCFCRVNEREKKKKKKKKGG